MNRSIFSRSLFIFFIYTLVLIGVFYALQRYLAPSFYYNSIINDYQAITDSIIERFESESLTLSDYEAIDDSILPSLYVYNNQGQLIYPTTGLDLTAFQTVDIFQNAPLDIVLEESTGYFIETYDSSGSTIFRLRNSVDAYITNFNSLNQIFLILIIAALSVMIPLSYGFAKTFSNPVVKLNKIAQKLSTLDFNIEKSLNRNDEIGMLENTLRAMAQSLKETIETLKEELEKEKELDRLQKQFVARVSHEIRTPLATIKASVESLVTHIKTPLSLDYETMINDEINHLVHLTDDLLDLAQLESGRFSIQKAPLDLVIMIQKIAQSLTVQTKRQIEMDMSSSFNVMADKKRMIQVFNNLLSNAITHSDLEGPIRIIQNESTLAIENPKKTIDPSKVSQLTNAFYKSQEKKQGYGLGLAIISAILTKHEIFMTLESNDDIFRVTLDFSKAIHSKKTLKN